MSYVKYQILEEAYDHYQRSWNEEFTFLPKSPEHLVNVINTVPTLMNNGFITNVSNNLLDCSSISLTPQNICHSPSHLTVLNMFALVGIVNSKT